MIASQSLYHLIKVAQVPPNIQSINRVIGEFFHAIYGLSFEHSKLLVRFSKNFVASSIWSVKGHFES